MAAIAHRRDMPILPVFCSWERGWRPAYRFLPPIPPERSVPRQEAAQRAVQSLFDLFTVRLRRAPAQFEHWIYLHRWLKPAPSLDDGALDAARRRVEHNLTSGLKVRWIPRSAELFVLGGRRLLVQARDGRMVPASDRVRAVVDVLRCAHGRSLPPSRLVAESRLDAEEVAQVLVSFEALDLLEWIDGEPARGAVLALGHD